MSAPRRGARADEHRALAPLLGAACLGASVPGAARLTYVSALAPGYLPAAPPAPQSSRRLRRQDRAASHLRRTGVTSSRCLRNTGSRLLWTRGEGVAGV